MAHLMLRGGTAEGKYANDEGDFGDHYGVGDLRCVDLLGGGSL
jgi:hypothetical protein